MHSLSTLNIPIGATTTRRSRLFLYALVLMFLPIGAGAVESGEGSALRASLWGILYVIAAYRLFVRDQVTLPEFVAGIGGPMLVLLAFIGLSVLWSAEPDISSRRGIQVAGLVFVALAATLRAHGGSIQSDLRAAVALLLIASAVIIVLFPKWGIAENGWRGITTQKNTFGQLCVLGLIAFWFSTTKGGIHAFMRFFWILVCIAGLILSRSVTSGIALAGAIGVVLIGIAWRAYKGSWRPALIVFLCVVAIALHATVVFHGFPDLFRALEDGLAVFGRDTTLTGRVTLWKVMLDHADKHALFGQGYGSFWIGFTGGAKQVALTVGWGYPGQAHNGWVDIYNEIGLVGLALVVVMLLNHAWTLIRLTRTAPEAARFHWALFIGLVLSNSAESLILRFTHPVWLVFVVSLIECRLLLRTHLSKADVAVEKARYSQ